jgi:hypothetical protein
MTRTFSVALWALAACGRVTSVGDASDSGAAGAEIDAAAGADGGRRADAAARCDPDGPIVDVQRVEGLNGQPFQCCAVFASDGTAYFAASQSGTFDGTSIYSAVATGGVFGERKLVAGSQNGDSRWKPTISRDGLHLYYNVRPAGGGLIRVVSSTRASSAEDFPAAQPVDLGAEPTESEADPFITEDGLFFARPGTIYLAAPAGGGFAPGRALTGLGMGPSKNHPVVSADGSRLYWGDYRTDTFLRAIWTARRGPAGPDDFQSPQLVEGDELAGTVDYPSWESEDGCALYFTSTRNGVDEIWVGRRLTR